MDWSAQLLALEALDRAGAHEQLDAALSALPAHPPDGAAGPIAYLRGKRLVQAGRHGAALPLLEQAVRLQPLLAQGHYLLGAVLAREALWLDAADALGRALELQPFHRAARLELAQVWLALGEPGEACQVLAPLDARGRRDPGLTTALWRARLRAAPLAQAPALLSEALAGPVRPADDLLLEALQLAGGLLLAGQWPLARGLLAALSRQGPSLEASSHPLPRRLALLLLLGLSLLDPPAEAEQAPARLAEELRSTLWLPPADREQQLWDALVLPWLAMLRGRLPAPIPAPIACHLSEALLVLDPQRQRSAAGWQRWLHSPPEDPWQRHSEDLPRLLELLPAQLQAGPAALLERRPALERALTQLSALMLERPSRLVLHPDPPLQAAALQLRQRSLNLLLQGERVLAGLAPARPPAPGPIRRWLLLASDGLPQCFLYRVQQKQEQLAALGAEARVLLLPALSDWAWSEQLLWAEAVIVCRLPALHPVLRAIAAARSAGLPVLYDIDDLDIDPEQSPPPLATYGGTLKPELHRRFRIDVPLYAAAMAACDGAIVSTPTLARRWQALQGRHRADAAPVWVLPNLAPPALREACRLPRAAASASAPVRLVLASGTTAHKQSWQRELAPALAVLLARHPRLELDLLGHLQLPLVLQPHAARIRCRPYCDYPTYLQRLAEADIGLVVLEESVFTDAKSAIRWMEFSHLGLAAVLSPTRTYTELLQEGEHALFARGTEAWIARIEALLADPQERLALARRAQRHARTLFGPEVAEAFWHPWLQRGRGPELLVRTPRQRLLLANVFFAPQSIGGATRVVQDQAAALLEQAADRYAITVLCSDHAPWQRPEEPEASAPELPLPVHCHDWHGARVVRLALPPTAWRVHQNEAMADFCRRWFAQERFDLVHAHCLQVLSVAPLQVARALGIPYAVTLHDGWWLSPRQFLITASGAPVDPADPLGHFDDPGQVDPKLIAADRQRRRDLEAVLAAAGARLAVSEAFADLHRRAGIAAVEVMENRWQPMPAGVPRRRRASGQPLRACFVGGMALHKGLAVLQSALLQAELPAPGLELTVVDASLDADQTLQLRWGSTPVRCVPAVPMQAMAAFYAEHDLLIAPSIWPESYGLVTREALSAGLWVVASEIGALADPIRHGQNGHRIPPRDPEALAAVLRELCARPPQPQPLLAFNAAATPLASELHRLYQRLLGEDSGS